MFILIQTLKRYTKIILAIALIAIFAYLVPSEDLSFRTAGAQELDQPFEITFFDGHTEVTQLPIAFVGKVNEVFTLRTQLPTTFPDHAGLKIYSAMQEIKVYLDDHMIFDSHTVESTEFLHVPSVYVWYFINLPPHSASSVLKIESYSPILSMSGIFEKIQYGDIDAMKFELVVSQLPKIFAIFILFLTSIIGFIVDVALTARGSSTRFKYLNIFFFSISIWLFKELDIIQFLTGNRFIIGSISFIFIPIGLSALIQFIKKVALENYHTIIDILSFIYFILTVANFILSIFFGFHFIEIMSYVLIYSILVMIVVLSLLIYEGFYFKNKTAQKYSFYIGFLFVMIFIDAFHFLTKDYLDLIDNILWGIMVFYLLIMFDTIMFVSSILKSSGEAAYLREMAYVDVLTGGNNRFKFEQDIDDYLDDQHQKYFRLIYLDMNELKNINDSMGHEVGDQAIIVFFQAMKSAFTSDANAKCYRIGGDEFAVVMEIHDEIVFRRCLKNFETDLKAKSIEYKFELSAGIGSDVFDYSTSFGEFKSRVDQLMYTNKYASKNIE